MATRPHFEQKIANESSKQVFESRWQEFLTKLKDIENEVLRRTKAKYSLENRLPQQSELQVLSEECLELTEIWYGKGQGNLSCFLSFFYRICEIAEITFYDYQKLTKNSKQSNDNFITLLDTGLKVTMTQSYQKNILDPYLNAGGLLKGGRSAIDNLDLPASRSRKEGMALIRHQYLKQYLLKFNKRAAKKPLKINGKVLKELEDWGQVHPDTQQLVANIANRDMKKLNHPNLTSATFEKFAQFLQNKPGEYFTDEKLQSEMAQQDPRLQDPRKFHLLIHTLGIWSGQLIQFNRNVIMNRSPIRYFSTKPWVRNFPLEDFTEQGRKIIRGPYVIEHSRIRVNQGPYQPMHCMSMASSSTKDLISPNYNFGFILDPKASNVENYSFDIEKCFQDAFALNPKSNKTNLPGECFFTVGQNTITGSSIKNTQHLQLSMGTLKDFPIYSNLKTKAEYYAAIKAEIDIISIYDPFIENEYFIKNSISKERIPEPFYLKITTMDLSFEPLIRFLNKLKTFLFEKYKGRENVDFHFQIVPEGNMGKFVIIFGPLARLKIETLEKKDAKETNYVNPDVGLSHRAFKSMEHVHLAHASGVWGPDPKQIEDVKVFSEQVLNNGKQELFKLWYFTAKLGAKKEVQEFIQQYFSKGFLLKETEKEALRTIESLSVRTLPRLPKEDRLRKFRKIQTEVNKRIQRHLLPIKFSYWDTKKTDEEIYQEFIKLNTARQKMWYTKLGVDTFESHADFKISQTVLVNNRYRKWHLLPFSYNRTDKSYNSSTVILNGLCFLALEAPQQSNVQTFYNLLHNQEVNTIVRLTRAFEEKTKKVESKTGVEAEQTVVIREDKCFDYWTGNIVSRADREQLRVPLESERNTKERVVDPGYELNYIATEDWIDNHSGSAKLLFDLIKSARKVSNGSSLIAVHCHSGVARTGTFILGYVIVDEIIRQLASGVKIDDLKINVGELLMQGSLQRFHFVGQVTQFRTVHQMIDLFVAELRESLQQDRSAMKRLKAEAGRFHNRLTIEAKEEHDKQDAIVANSSNNSNSSSNKGLLHSFTDYMSNNRLAFGIAASVGAVGVAATYLFKKNR